MRKGVHVESSLQGGIFFERKDFALNLRLSVDTANCHILEKGKGRLFQMEGLVKQMTLTEP